MTLDILEGRRKKWMPPISLFLLINLFYFGFTRLADLNLSLSDQLRQPHHSGLASYLVDRKLSKENITLEDLSSAYNRKSSTFANTLIILHVPIFAAFLALLLFKKKFFYTDHFIYSLHFVSLVLLLGLIQSGLISLFSWLHLLTKAFWPVFGSISLGVIVLYAFFSIKKVYQYKTVYATLLVLPITMMFVATHMIYRTIQFLIIITLI